MIYWSFASNRNQRHGSDTTRFPPDLHAQTVSWSEKYQTATPHSGSWAVKNLMLGIPNVIQVDGCFQWLLFDPQYLMLRTNRRLVQMELNVKETGRNTVLVTHRNMLERFIADELRAADKTFSKSKISALFLTAPALSFNSTAPEQQWQVNIKWYHTSVTSVTTDRGSVLVPLSLLTPV